MNKTKISILTLISLLLFPAPLLADAVKGEWFGTWTMNHDGFAGNLQLKELKADCANTAWCDMSVSYLDNKGIRHAGLIEKIDDKYQHLVFYINFPGNKQKFDAYIFSWDKQKLAGTTYWRGRTFGFYANKKKV